MKKQFNGYDQLRNCVSLVNKDRPTSDCQKAIKTLAWELMKAITRITKLERKLMDKEIHKISKKIKVAEKDIKQGKVKTAQAVLKKAEKKNEKLVKIDKTQRDPVIHAVEKAGKCKGKACASKVKKLVRKKK